MNARFFNTLVKLRAVYGLLYSLRKPKEGERQAAGVVLAVTPEGAVAAAGKRLLAAEAYYADFLGYWGVEEFHPTLGKTPEQVAELVKLHSDMTELSRSIEASPQVSEILERSLEVAAGLLAKVNPAV